MMKKNLVFLLSYFYVNFFYKNMLAMCLSEIGLFLKFEKSLD